MKYNLIPVADNQELKLGTLTDFGVINNIISEVGTTYFINDKPVFRDEFEPIHFELNGNTVDKKLELQLIKTHNITFPVEIGKSICEVKENEFVVIDKCARCMVIKTQTLRNEKR